MFEKALIMYIYAETPIHAGSGTAISGAVDLPIQRERHTEFPIIQGSSLKGVLRNSACWVNIDIQCNGCNKLPEKRENCEILKEMFGSPEGIGGISLTDARILAFPVRSLKGVFCWVTCPMILDRYKRDLKMANIHTSWETPKPEKDEQVIIGDNSELEYEKRVYIEDLQFEVKKDDKIKEIAKDMKKALPNDVFKETKEKLMRDLVIISNEVFRDLVTLTTEVMTRVKIKYETGIVESGGLWSEEYLPTDTLMYSLILIPSKLNKLKPQNVENKIEKFNEKILQIGGDETIGKGFAMIKMVKKESELNVKKP